MMGSDSSDVRSSLRTSLPVRLSRYDLQLWVIPLAFLLALAVATVFSMSTRTTLFAASAIGVLVLFDGLFRNPPTVGAPA